MSLPTVEAALTRMLAQVVPLPAESVPISEADGRWLAKAVMAVRDQPPFDASAMDGWAVRSADVAAAATLAIVGESAAGRRFDAVLETAQTVRIFTGAPLPRGADRVIVQEEAERRGDRIACGPAGAGPAYVRPRGCDFRRGDVLLAAGARLTPWRLALAASAGAGLVTCGARPRVAILATGDELVAPGQPAGPDQVYDSAAPALGALVGRHGGTPSRPAVAGDSEDAILSAVSSATFDILVTVGGASVGDHDLAKPALRNLGAVLHVEGVAVRPGKPVWFATLADGRVVLGLPGNPASALVCAELFLGPILARSQGGTPEDRFEPATLTKPLAANGPRDHYVRARVEREPDGRQTVTPFADQDSSLVTILAAADSLIRRPPGAPAVEAGAVVGILRPTL